jgi:hypothetical protein
MELFDGVIVFKFDSFLVRFVICEFVSRFNIILAWLM